MTIGEIFALFANPFASVAAIRDFLELGGQVLVLQFGLALLLWTLIYERLRYYRGGFAALTQAHHARWRQVRPRAARHVRTALICDARLHAEAHLALIRVLVQAAPLIGLLGTVTGMIELFDVIAQTGSGNARAMASGIARATLPTLAGLGIALPGLFFAAALARRARRAVARFADALV